MAISARYPLVEILGGALAACAIWRFGPTWEALAACGFLWTLLALTFIDFDTQLLPDDITLPLLWAGLAVNLFGVFVPLRDAVIGAIAGYLALWTVYWLFKLIRGKEGMGYGDFKLLAALGAWLGWQMLSADRPDVVGRRRGHRHHAGRLQGARPQHSAGVRPVSGNCRRDRAVLRPTLHSAARSMMNAPLVIGLTGGIGSGKSEVTRAFAARGVEFADADLAAHALTARGAPGFAGVVAEFGPQTVDAGGELDRAWLRRRVFADADARARLEAILHPLIHAYLERAVAAWTGAYGLLSVPLLLERGGLLSARRARPRRRLSRGGTGAARGRAQRDGAGRGSRGHGHADGPRGATGAGRRRHRQQRYDSGHCTPGGATRCAVPRTRSAPAGRRQDQRLNPHGACSQNDPLIPRRRAPK